MKNSRMYWQGEFSVLYSIIKRTKIFMIPKISKRFGVQFNKKFFNCSNDLLIPELCWTRSWPRTRPWSLRVFGGLDTSDFFQTGSPPNPAQATIS